MEGVWEWRRAYYGKVLQVPRPFLCFYLKLLHPDGLRKLKFWKEPASNLVQYPRPQIMNFAVGIKAGRVSTKCEGDSLDSWVGGSSKLQTDSANRTSTHLGTGSALQQSR